MSTAPISCGVTRPQRGAGDQQEQPLYVLRKAARHFGRARPFDGTLGVVAYARAGDGQAAAKGNDTESRSEEHTSELQSLMRISYAVFCLKKKNRKTNKNNTTTIHKSTIISPNITHHKQN